ncbi:hypothetical protein [Nonomuraea basaltis]|uniref:hypothetical protein n=1 Tax=Nonomuraea basaltis TaxID=2495887 RepID=UPI00110C6530|nr:hypothetical protein [Nonomuraea basaltis]TMR95453.1 hypothetical protein EJK15_28515 [Nonomuraea basaltis]
MAAAKVTVRAPSGRIVDITAGTEEKILGVNTSCMLTTGKTSRVFMIGARGYHDIACEAVVKASLAWRGYVAGRELVASMSDDGAVLVTTLLGPFHELMTVWADGVPNQKRIEDVFASLVIEDTAEGMVVKPNSDSFASHAWEDVGVIVEGRGSLHVPDATGAGGMTPSWRGAKTQKGELWKRPLPDRETSAASVRDYFYILGCPRGSAEIKLSSDAPASDSDLLNWLDVLEIAWR